MAASTASPFPSTRAHEASAPLTPNEPINRLESSDVKGVALTPRKTPTRCR